MKLTPSQRLCALGAILLAALALCSRNFSHTGEPSFLMPLGVAGVAYLLAIHELFYTPQFPRRVILFGLGLSGPNATRAFCEHSLTIGADPP